MKTKDHVKLLEIVNQVDKSRMDHVLLYMMYCEKAQVDSLYLIAYFHRDLQDEYIILDMIDERKKNYPISKN